MSRLSNLKDKYGNPVKKKLDHRRFRSILDGKKRRRDREILIAQKKAWGLLKQREDSCRAKMRMRELQLAAAEISQNWIFGCDIPIRKAESEGQSCRVQQPGGSHPPAALTN